MVAKCLDWMMKQTPETVDEWVAESGEGIQDFLNKENDAIIDSTD